MRIFLIFRAGPVCSPGSATRRGALYLCKSLLAGAGSPPFLFHDGSGAVNYLGCMDVGGELWGFNRFNNQNYATGNPWGPNYARNRPRVINSIFRAPLRRP
ncbi:hypothetical protein ARMGADRAFT_670849 [Armillaria gallica]|uniref:Uncharacterized protein n=1 Tax=Armillaria gallica TaxID=47427 RepID=A0A2H3CK57_ARMGA|nr:hypothetical protein ARMGADRAFT_670849 [Armillaria gallica]